MRNRMLLMFGLIAVACTSVMAQRYATLEEELRAFVADKDARIGIAVIINGNDTVCVNGDKDFPMLSVYKFPQALAVSEYCLRSGMSASDSIDIAASEMKENTYSPLRDKYGVTDLRLPVKELLAYSLQLSDNNACDILFRLIGGTQVAGSLMKRMGLEDIVIASTEDEMHRDMYLCYHNRATPLAMASLVDRFDSKLRYKTAENKLIAELMETCSTGTDRLVTSLPTSAVIGHKTGTGDRNQDGRIIAVNDVGYIHFARDKRCSIAVFVADSNYDMGVTSAFIAKISAIVVRHITEEEG